MYKVVYKKSSFVDYKGDTIDFILAAVSIPVDEALVVLDPNEEAELTEGYVSKILSIGASFRNPEDKWDEDLGQRLAYGRALKNRDHILATSDSGMINTKVVEAVLEQEAAYMQVNPGRYIYSYNEKREKYTTRVVREAYRKSMSPTLKAAMKEIASLDTKSLELFLEEMNDEFTKFASGSSDSESTIASDQPVDA